MENLRSKRRQVVQKDEVDEAIGRMGKRLRFNPITRHWLKFLLWGFLFAGIFSTVAPQYARGGIGGIFSFLFSFALQLTIGLMFGIIQFVGIMWFMSRGRT